MILKKDTLAQISFVLLFHRLVQIVHDGMRTTRFERIMNTTIDPNAVLVLGSDQAHGPRV